MRHIFNESEMALFFECLLLCAQKVLDTADIVREAMFRQQSKRITVHGSVCACLPLKSTRWNTTVCFLPYRFNKLRGDAEGH